MVGHLGQALLGGADKGKTAEVSVERVEGDVVKRIVYCD